MRRLLPLCLLFAAACASAPRVPFTDAAAASAFEAAPAAYADSDTSHGFVHTVLLYIPNRIFDVFDIVRARVRLGPGFAISAQATQLAGARAGFYSTVFIGIPGPRLEPSLNLPFGVEALAGAGVTAVGADVGLEAGGPHYGYGEFEFGFQAAIIGVDVGVDPWEVVDFLCGILTFDPVGDDL
jgi:hypothetical protein